MKNLNLKAARAAKDMSQDDLAKLCGVSRQTINAIEKGDYNPTIKLCRSICRAAGESEWIIMLFAICRCSMMARDRKKSWKSDVSCTVCEILKNCCELY